VKKFDDTCIHLDTIPQRDRQTDRQTDRRTDRQKWYITVALCMLAHAHAQ